MRKYRGKRIDNGEWVYGDLINYRENEKRILYQNGGAWDILEASDIVDPATVGQSTGLTDKNGVEIFEGDVIEYKAFDMCAPRLRPVVWSDRECGYVLKDANFMPKDGIVIGNIHDNPELLREE